MTKDTAVRALSDDELDSVSGGATSEPVCEGPKFTFFGLTFNFQTCGYATTK
jgi:hypothetical protein